VQGLQKPTGLLTRASRSEAQTNVMSDQPHYVSLDVYACYVMLCRLGFCRILFVLTWSSQRYLMEFYTRLTNVYGVKDLRIFLQNISSSKYCLLKSNFLTFFLLHLVFVRAVIVHPMLNKNVYFSLSECMSFSSHLKSDLWLPE